MSHKTRYQFYILILILYEDNIIIYMYVSAFKWMLILFHDYINLLKH